MTLDTRQRVLHAAGAIFAEKGFQETTVREICAAAGTNLAAVNYYFRDKESLYVEAVRLAHRLRMEHTPPPRWPANATAARKLEIFIKNILTRMLATPNVQWPMRLMMREMLQPTIACQPLVEEFIRPQLAQLMDILCELLPDGTPEYRLHQIAFSIIGQCLHYRVAGDFVALLIPEEELASHFDVDQLADHITRFSLAAIRGYGRTEESPTKATTEQPAATNRAAERP